MELTAKEAKKPLNSVQTKLAPVYVCFSEEDMVTLNL